MKLIPKYFGAENFPVNIYELLINILFCIYT